MSVIDQLADRIRDHAVSVARRAADLTVEDTKAAASRRTGALADGISHTEPSLSGNIVSCQIISSAEYSAAQDTGSGIYGPTGSRIFPTHAKALRFDWPAAGGIVYAKSVAGSPGTHFFSEAMPGRWANAVQVSGGAP